MSRRDKRRRESAKAWLRARERVERFKQQRSGCSPEVPCDLCARRADHWHPPGTKLPA